MEKIQKRIKPYLQALPDLFVYQIATKIVLGLWLFLLDMIFLQLLKSSGRVAVTSVNGILEILFQSKLS